MTSSGCRLSVQVALSNSRPGTGRCRCFACIQRYSSAGMTNAGREGMVLAHETASVHDPERKRAATANSEGLMEGL